MKTWYCKIGGADTNDVPDGGDAPMRDAIERTYRRIVGEDPMYTFSGWGAKLTEPELAVVEDRLPDRSKVTREVPYDVTDEMVEAAMDVYYGNRWLIETGDRAKATREALE